MVLKANRTALIPKINLLVMIDKVEFALKFFKAELVSARGEMQI